MGKNLHRPLEKISRRLLLSGGLAGALVPCSFSSTQAQPQTTAPPLRGTLNLQNGFMPDPYRVQVQAGGEVDSEDYFRRNAGWVSYNPDLNLVWGGGPRLYFYVDSPYDTTLLINCSRGHWRSNDDHLGTNPLVSFSPAYNGRFNVWVGRYERGNPVWVTLRISEFPPSG